MTLQIYTNLHHSQFKSQKFSGEGLLAFSRTSPSILARSLPQFRFRPQISDLVFILDLVLWGNYISGGGVNLMHIWCVLVVFLDWEFGIRGYIPREDSLN